MVARPDHHPLSSADLKAVAADYDGLMPATPTRGHIGDVRVFKTCAEPSGVALATAATEAKEAPITVGDRFDLAVEKKTIGQCRIDGVCRVEVKLWNRGSDTFLGPLLVSDSLERAGARLISTGPSRWICGQGGAEISCRHPQIEIQPGRATSLFLEYRLPAKWSYPEFADCASIGWISDLTSGRLIYAVEIELGRLGYYKGAADGIAGPQLKAAIAAYQTAKSLPPSGDLTRELVEGLLGAGVLVAGDADPNNDRACARFHVAVPDGTTAYVAPDMPVETIDPPIITQTVEVIDEGCPDGYWNRGGTCVLSCPWGYTGVGDVCVPIGGDRCSNGWFVGGFCTCPDGYSPERRSGGRTICEANFPDRPHRCFGGFLSGDRCSCPWGTVATPVPGGLACRPNERVQCFGGLVFGDRCQCPAGSELLGGRCRPGQPVVDCPIGTHRQFGHCVPIGVPQICPPGQIRQGLFCVPVRPHCLPNQIERGGHCLPIGIQIPQQPNPNLPQHPACLGGQMWNGQACVLPNKPPQPGPNGNQTNCPAGTIRRGGNCLPFVVNPAQPPTCAPGLIWNGKACSAPTVQPHLPNKPNQPQPTIGVPNCPPGTIRIGKVCTATVTKPPVIPHKPEPHVVVPPHISVQPHVEIKPHVTPQPHVQQPPHIQVQPHVQPAPHIQVQPHVQPHPAPTQPHCKKFENGRCVQF